MSHRALILLAFAGVVVAQPPMNGGDRPPPPGGGTNKGGGAGGTGESSSTECTGSTTSCSRDGSSNFVKRSLTYSNGIFTGDVITNQCPNKKSDTPGSSPTCVKQTFPDPSFKTTPAAAPGLGRVGLSLSGGVNVYGPMEAGFMLGQACSNNAGDCVEGVDVATCENELNAECEPANVKTEMFMDDCGGHANPYHFHTDLACEYTVTDSSAHSPVIAVMLDGRGLYGKWESSGKTPSDLDACGGHTGPVPASSEYGTTAGTVYHYHMQDKPPFTVGCYGPVSSLDQCKGLYTECSAAENSIKIAQLDGNTYSYQQWCTCYSHSGTCNIDQYPGLCAGQGTLTVAAESGVSGGDPASSSGGSSGGSSSASDLRASPLLVVAVAAAAMLMAH